VHSSAMPYAVAAAADTSCAVVVVAAAAAVVVVVVVAAAAGVAGAWQFAFEYPVPIAESVTSADDTHQIRTVYMTQQRARTVVYTT